MTPRRLRPLATFALGALAVLVLSGAPAQPAPVPGLVAAYGFEEGTGTSTADASGTGNTGTLSGAGWAAGHYGGGLSFDGTNDMVTIADAASLDFTGGMTLEAWVRPRSLAGWRSIILKERGSHLSYALYANSSTNTPSGHVYIGGDRSARGTSQIPLNAWTHLAVTYDGAALRVYVNGTQAGSRSQTGSIAVSSGALRIGGNTVWPEWFDGFVDEVRLYNRALSAADIQGDMATPVVGSPPPPDTTAPTVSLTAPAEGATVSSTVSVSASASDDVGVAGVQFRLGGADLGAEDTSAPYSVSWDTTTTTNGAKVLTAVARDAAGNTSTSAPVNVTVSNSAPGLALVGRWEGPYDWPVVAVHAGLQPNGKVLLIDGFAHALSTERLWDPATGTFTAVGHNRNLFCSGHVALADGRTFVAGGHVSAYAGIADATLFDWRTNAWTRAPDMARERWYPTVTVLPDGRALVVSGDNITRDVPGQTPPFTNPSDTLPELYDPSTNGWTQLTAAQRRMPLYPFMFVLPDGRVLDAGPDTQTRVLDVDAHTWTPIATSPIDGHSALMYRPGKILKSGTWADPDFDNLTVTDRAVVLDATQATPAWREVAPIGFRRTYHTLTALPDGTVLASGGSTTSEGTILANGVLPAEIWNPDTETWTTVAAMQTSRLYHSTSLLLPDGRILVAGGGRASGATAQLSAEAYSPPYLFKGPRPTISNAPSELAYGAPFSVPTPDASSIEKVALVRPGSVTHSLDMDQRYVPLTFTRGPGELQVDAPASGNLAPPGYYMLFVVNGNGVPSVASFVRLPAPHEDDEPPTAPGNLTAAGGVGTATLTWSAATDNVGVTRYNVHRSTSPGFTPTAANRIAQPAGTSYTNSGLAAGTHYYVVTASDAAGNVSAPSNEASAIVTAEPNPPPAGLVAAYGFEEGSGSTAADASGAGNAGTLSGASWTSAGRYGNALSFDGTNDMVTIADAASLDLTGGMTLEAWVNPRTLPSGSWRSILLKERGRHLSYALYANSSTNAPSGHVYIGGDRSARGTSQIPLNAWTHLAVTYSGSALRVYVNGTQVGVRNQMGSIAVSTGALRIGGNTVWPEWFDGLIDDVRVYNRALSSSEIQSDMAGAVG